MLSLMLLKNGFVVLNFFTGRIMRKLLHHGNALKVSYQFLNSVKV